MPRPPPRAAKPVLANFIVTEGTLAACGQEPRRVPWFAYPESAARAVARIAPYGEWVNRPEGRAPSFGDVDPSRARENRGRRLAPGVGRAPPPPGPRPPWAAKSGSVSAVVLVWLDSIGALELLKAYRIPDPALRASLDAVRGRRGRGGHRFPVALKLDAPTLVHKSDVGGVRLHLGTADDVASAAESLLARFGPGVPLLVQPMGPDGVETVVGVVEDPSFGPLVMFGLGGKEAELFRDEIWSLVPMTSRTPVTW